MEIQKVASEIELKIRTLEKGRGLLQQFAENKAATAAAYDKEIAFTIIRLKNGTEMELSGQKVVDPPASYTEKIAKGICWNAKLQLEKAEAEYKIAIEKLKCIQAELSGYQSIYKFMENI
jgi:hypothetical protein